MSEAVIEHPINRPPKPPAAALGPYFQFLTTDLEQNQWIGSVLIFRHVSFSQPTISFDSSAKVDYDWEVLYENLFDMKIYRINLTIELREGNDDEKIQWAIDWNDFNSNGTFYIAQRNQKWRGGFFSCNGFDATIPKERAEGLNYDNVWNQLYSIHEQTPLHILLWGGDQSYNDFVIEDVPYLKTWSELPFDDKWTYEFDGDAQIEAEKYYFYTYAEHWERRPEMKRALSSIPSLMMWDDHDIFDGAGSYPPLLQQSPIMSGLFRIAQKLRLLFQHHTTPDKARQHGLFGYQGHNFLARCGPKLLILGTDGRSERTEKTVGHEQSWEMIFDRLSGNLDGIEHLIVLVAVPFSFVRMKLAESILERLKNFALVWKDSKILKTTNSVFGLPEPYDDLLDEWTHNDHIDERNRVLARFQKVSEEKKIRITFFSGDVHCCGVSRFRTSTNEILLPLNDDKLMYQIISSAIVNMPPSRLAIRVAHFFATKWYPLENTEEEIIDFFEKMPENGLQLYLRKLLPNRNWCYFEQTIEKATAGDPSVQIGYLEAIRSNIAYAFGYIGLSRFFWWTNAEDTAKPIQEDARDMIIPEDSHPSEKKNNLKIRFWLESTERENNPDHEFASYGLCVPNLE